MWANPFAIIVCAILIGGAIIGTQFVNHYQIVAAGGEGNVVAWRLNTRTGEIDYCIASQNPFNQFDTDTKDHMFSVECKKDIRTRDVKP